MSDSSSDSEEESDPFYSVNDPRARQRRKQRQDQKNRQSKVCVNLTITKGKVRTSTPLVVNIHDYTIYIVDFWINLSIYCVF